MSTTLNVALSLFLFISSAVAQTPGAVSPFNGKDLTGWTTKEPADRSHWTVGKASLREGDEQSIAVAASKRDGHLINAEAHGVDIYSTQKFGDVRITLEVMVLKGSNSGIYVLGEYEIQVFDSYGKEKLGGGDMGAIYSAASPKTNAQKKPGDWNKYVIDFHAPKFDESGNRTSKAKFAKVQLNGSTIHENVEMDGPTPGGVSGKENATGPIMFQGDHGPIAYRNITITALSN